MMRLKRIEQATAAHKDVDALLRAIGDESGTPALRPRTRSDATLRIVAGPRMLDRSEQRRSSSRRRGHAASRCAGKADLKVGLDELIADPCFLLPKPGLTPWA